MQYNDENEHKKDKNITCTYKDNVVQMTFNLFQSHICAVYMALCLSDCYCLSVTSRCSMETDERMELIFAMGAFFHVSYTESLS